jgi:hypothetical protein
MAGEYQHTVIGNSNPRASLARLSRLSRRAVCGKGFCATGRRQREDTKTMHAFRRAALIETRSRTHCVEIAARADAVCFVKWKRKNRDCRTPFVWNRLLFNRASRRGNVSFKIPHLCMHVRSQKKCR